jgi:hypothetical protein
MLKGGDQLERIPQPPSHRDVQDRQGGAGASFAQHYPVEEKVLGPTEKARIVSLD